MRVPLLQTAGIALAAVLAALTVAACGTIGFVGLMAPHLTRKLVGAPHGISVPGSMLVGATLTVGADLAARTLLAGTELPVGVVTGALGCLFFLALVAGKKLTVIRTGGAALKKALCPRQEATRQKSMAPARACSRSPYRLPPCKLQCR